MNKNGSFRSHQTCNSNDQCIIFIKSLILLVLWSQVLVCFKYKLINFQWKLLNVKTWNVLNFAKSSQVYYIYTLSFCEGNLTNQFGGITQNTNLWNADFEGKFWVKRCGLSACVYSTYLPAVLLGKYQTSTLMHYWPQYHLVSMAQSHFEIFTQTQ